MYCNWDSIVIYYALNKPHYACNQPHERVNKNSGLIRMNLHINTQSNGYNHMFIKKLQRIKQNITNVQSGEGMAWRLIYATHCRMCKYSWFTYMMFLQDFLTQLLLELSKRHVALHHKASISVNEIIGISSEE